MIWNTILRIFLLLGFYVAVAYGQAEDTAHTTASTGGPGTSAPPPPQNEGSGGLTSDQRAALWAGFVGGMVCIFGIGMLFYDLVVRKYANQYRYAHNVDMHVENYKP